VKHQERLIQQQKNTIINELYILLCYLDLAEQHDILEATIQGFYDNSFTLKYGDDVVVVTADKIKEWFNMIKISNWFSAHGIVFTDPKKNIICREFVPEEEVTFLKRFFRPAANGIVYAPMEPSALFEIVNWVRVSKFNTPQEMLRANVEDVVRDSVHYGRTSFRKIKTILNRALVSVGITPVNMIYTSIHLDMYGTIPPDINYDFFVGDHDLWIETNLYQQEKMI